MKIVSSSAMMETYTPIVPYTSKSKLVTVGAGSFGLVSYMIIVILTILEKFSALLAVHTIHLLI